jgi:hypothetical protein
MVRSTEEEMKESVWFDAVSTKLGS